MIGREGGNFAFGFPIEFSLLARRPAELAPAQQMKVKVEDALPRILVAVGDDPEAFFRDFFFARDVVGRKVDGAHQIPVLFAELEQGLDVFFRNDEDVRRRLGVYVSKSVQDVVLVDFLGRHFAVYDLAKEAVLHFRP